MAVAEFTSLVMALAVRFPLSVTSWGRSTRRNHQIGGVADSLHLTWMAVDVVLDDPVQQDAFLQAAKRIGMEVVVEDDHLHVQIPRT